MSLSVKTASRRAALAAVASACLLSCAAGPASTEPSIADSGPRFVLELRPGPEYRTPQTAVWVETPGGEYRGTLFVTERAARGRWRMAPKTGRPEALPVWTHARSHTAEADVVASATPRYALPREIRAAEGFSPGAYVIWMEVNRSFDYNDRYPKSLGVCGQPSVVYRAEVQVGPNPCEAAFAPVGTGSPDGSDGEIRPGLPGITTALEIYESPTVSFLPE